MGRTATSIRVALASVLLAVPAAATDWHVPQDAATIQAGIDLATEGDNVIIDCGTYYEHDLVLKSGVTLRSDTQDPNCVIIDAQQQGRVIYGMNLLSDTRIEGLTLTGGLAIGSEPAGDGAAIYCYNSVLRVQNCILTANSAERNGGALFIGHSNNTLVSDCTFEENHCGGVGGGMEYWESDAELVGCRFFGNYSDTHGGAIDLNASDMTIRSCVIGDNVADLEGGGLHAANSSPDIGFCTFSGNGAQDGGALRVVSDGTASLVLCILSFSTAGAAVSVDATSSVAPSCCLVWQNAGGDWVDGLAGLAGVDGNFGADPGFCDATNHDFHVCSDSWVLAGRHPWCGPAGLVGALSAGCPACTPTATTESTWGSVKAVYR
jgi:hypothetical protein